MMTNGDFQKTISKLGFELSDYLRLMEFLYGFSRTDILNKNIELPDRVEADLAKLKKGYPIDYLIGFVEIFGLRFHVDERVLIPRVETEELVCNIFRRESENDVRNILDIGTGSGFIALSLAKLLASKPKVHATDISQSALTVANINAVENDCDICFHECDVLKGFDADCLFDIIVSNPPYVKLDENLDSSLSFEPALALYGGVDGLLCFRRIADEVKPFVKRETRFYFECSPLTADGVVEIMQRAFPFHSFFKVKDMSKKDRFVYGICRL